MPRDRPAGVGYNIENRHLMAALDARARVLPALYRTEAAGSVSRRKGEVCIHLGDGRRSRLALSARRRIDVPYGRGITVESWAYPQTALTLIPPPHAATRNAFDGTFTPGRPIHAVPCRASAPALSGSPRRPRGRADGDGRRRAVRRSRAAIPFHLGKITVEPAAERFRWRCRRSSNSRPVASPHREARTSFRRSARKG